MELESPDGRGAAPGANDDASGVAVSLACVRALSKLRFPATLVFAAVAGEEAGAAGFGAPCPPRARARLATGGSTEQRHRGRKHDTGQRAPTQEPGAGVFRGHSSGSDISRDSPHPRARRRERFT